MTHSTDELLSLLGSPGRYQVLVVGLLALNSFVFVFNLVSAAFFVADPIAFRCSSSREYDKNYTDVNDSCQIYDFSDHKDTWCPIRENCTSCNKSSHFVVEERERTVVTEFDLVCERQYLTGLSTTIFYAGHILGSISFGTVAEFMGRWPAMMTTLYMSIAVGIAIFFTQSFIIFTLLRFVLGFLSEGLSNATITLAMETLSSKYHSTAVMFVMLFWGITNAYVALLAYLVRDWRWIQLWASLLGLISLFYTWLFPESLRWLIAKKKFKRAEKLIERIQRYNGRKDMPEDVKIAFQRCKDEGERFEHTSIKHLFQNKPILLQSLIFWVVWFSFGMCYYGLVLSTGALHGSKYINYFIGSAVEITAFLIMLVLPKTVGRRRPLFVCFLLSGASCIASGNVTDGSVKTGLALSGRFWATGVHCGIYLFTSELYPTTFRAIGLGSCTVWVGIGAMIAPQINYLGTISYRSLPITLYGCLAVLAAFLVMVLPETGERETPDTLKDQELIGWGCCQKKWNEETDNNKQTDNYKKTSECL